VVFLGIKMEMGRHGRLLGAGKCDNTGIKFISK
jgi:hypothetical protein